SRLLAEHRRLDAELAARVEATRAARRLLVEVADTEAAAIDRMLTARAVPTITALTEVIGELAGRPDDVGGYATRMLGELDELTDELDRLVHGLPPSRLADTGLAVALADLAARTPAVTLGRVPAERFALSTEA